MNRTDDGTTYAALFLSICVQHLTYGQVEERKTYEIQNVYENEDGHAFVQLPKQLPFKLLPRFGPAEICVVASKLGVPAFRALRRVFEDRFAEVHGKRQGGLLLRDIASPKDYIRGIVDGERASLERRTDRR